MSIFNSDKQNSTLSAARELGLALLGLLIVILITETILRAFNDFGRVVPAKVRALEDEQGQELYAGRPWRKLEFIVPKRLNAEGVGANRPSPGPTKPKDPIMFGRAILWRTVA